jgi:ribosomal protein L21E
MIRSKPRAHGMSAVGWAAPVRKKLKRPVRFRRRPKKIVMAVMDFMNGIVVHATIESTVAKVAGLKIDANEAARKFDSG